MPVERENGGCGKLISIGMNFVMNTRLCAPFSLISHNSMILYRDSDTLHTQTTNFKSTIMSDAGTGLPPDGGGCKHDAQNTTALRPFQRSSTAMLQRFNYM